MTETNDPGIAPNGSVAWFCLRSQPKHEHIAAAQLRQAGIEAFAPRIRFKRATRRGPAWFTEALFPNYLFARFNWNDSLRKVHHANGVAGVVHFGEKWPTIPDEVIAELRLTLGEAEIHVIEDSLKSGDEVKITGGIFNGLNAIVTQVVSSRERVCVLLEFLGRQTSVEIGRDTVVKEADERKAIL